MGGHGGVDAGVMGTTTARFNVGRPHRGRWCRTRGTAENCKDEGHSKRCIVRASQEIAGTRTAAEKYKTISPQKIAGTKP